MVRIQYFNPFLFPSSFPSHESDESTAQMPQSSSPSASYPSAWSPNSPYESSSSVRGPSPSQSSFFYPPRDDAYGPCAACKINGRLCSDPCYLASYIPSDDVHKFAAVGTVFGWGDLNNFLQIQENRSPSNYVPLLVLLKDTSKDEEVQPNLENSEPMDIDNKLVTVPSISEMVRLRRTKIARKVKTLQQLMFSPFIRDVHEQKSDTASLFLHIIDHIGFLHQQVTFLSKSYVKHEAPITHLQSDGDNSQDDEQNQDLRSQGLCLAPVWCAFLLNIDVSEWV